MFIGYPRTSHSLVGALLDAHPEIIIPHEYDVIKNWKLYRPSTLRNEKMSKYYLFYDLHQLSKEQAMFGRRSNYARGRTRSYSYKVPGLWQGGYQTKIKVLQENIFFIFVSLFIFWSFPQSSLSLSFSLPPLPPSFCLIVCLFVCSFVSIFLSLYPLCSLFPKVIGDKKGGQTALLLDQLGDLSILGEIEQVVQLPMKFIHVHRNPFDNIAAITLRSTESRTRKERVKVSRRLIWSFFLYY